MCSSSPTGSPGSNGGRGVITIRPSFLSIFITAPSSKPNSMRSSCGMGIWPCFILIRGNFTTVIPIVRFALKNFRSNAYAVAPLLCHGWYKTPYLCSHLCAGYGRTEPNGLCQRPNLISDIHYYPMLSANYGLNLPLPALNKGGGPHPETGRSNLKPLFIG